MTRLTTKSDPIRARAWQHHEKVYNPGPERNTGGMLLVFLYCGFYLSGLLISRWMVLARHALITGCAITLAAGLGALTLWLITLPGWIDPWLAIAMVGTIALPALIMGLGLLAGGWIRHSRKSAPSIAVAVLLPVLALVIPLVA